MHTDLDQLISTVQHNCHISDAKYAGNYTMCIYLLKMREYYRWETANGFSDQLLPENIGAWISQREALWEELEDQCYQSLSIANACLDPFQSDDINRVLAPQQLIYSAGYGIKAKPHFFIAQLEQQQQYNHYNIYIAGKEYARDLTSPPAMSHNKTIYIRRESFKRMLWERIEEWRWHKPQNALARTINCYAFEDDIDLALNNMTDNELQAAILHEIGEIQAGETLHGWQDMMQAIIFTQAEIMARAVRDHFADTLHTLPALLKNTEKHPDQHASIHFYFANLTAMRKQLFPSLIQAYQQWLQNNDMTVIQKTVKHARLHWQKLAEDILAIYQQQADQPGRQIADEIEKRVNNSHL